jgi:hypothetical protein
MIVSMVRLVVYPRFRTSILLDGHFLTQIQLWATIRAMHSVSDCLQWLLIQLWLQMNPVCLTHIPSTQGVWAICPSVTLPFWALHSPVEPLLGLIGVCIQSLILWYGQSLLRSFNRVIISVSLRFTLVLHTRDLVRSGKGGSSIMAYVYQCIPNVF